MNIDSLESLGNIIGRKLGIAELNNCSIEYTTNMTLTQVTLIEVEINENPSTLSSSDPSLLTFLAS